MVDLMTLAVDGQPFTVQLARRVKAAASKRTSTQAHLVLEDGELIPLGEPQQRQTPDPAVLEAEIKKVLLFKTAQRVGGDPLDPRVLVRVLEAARAEDPSDQHIASRLAQYTLFVLEDRLRGEARHFQATARSLRVLGENVRAFARQAEGIGDAAEE